MVLPILAAIAAPLIGGAISAFGAASKEAAQKRAQDEYLAEYATYKANVEATPQITKISNTRDERSSVDLGALVAASEAAGFNPMTVLRAGGLAYFANTHTSDMTIQEAPKLWVPPAPRDGFSPGGAAAMQFGNAVSSIDLSAAYSNMAQANLANAQMAALGRTSAGLSSAPAGASHVAAQRSGGAKVTAPVLGSSWLAAPDPKTDKLPIWVPGVDRDGMPIWVPNPDGPDIEQAAYAAIARSQAGWERAAESLVNLPSNVKVQKVPSSQLPSGWRQYLPSFSIEWN